MYKRNRLFRMNIMEEILDIRNCIEILVIDISKSTEFLARKSLDWIEQCLTSPTTQYQSTEGKKATKEKPRKSTKTTENTHIHTKYTYKTQQVP